MRSSPASEKATSSVRRITGGSSPWLSGSGVPSPLPGVIRSLGRTRTIPLRHGVFGPHAYDKGDNVQAPCGFHRGFVKRRSLDCDVAAAARRGTCVGSPALNDQRITLMQASNGAAHDEVLCSPTLIA